MLFARVGKGTLAPWDATQRLVVVGPYRYVRNPMISGVLAILLGETLAFWSAPLLAWFAAVFAVNAIYMPLVEEPGAQPAGSARTTSGTARTFVDGCRGSSVDGVSCATSFGGATST